MTQPKDQRPVHLDQTDRRMLALLRANARQTNQALADALDIAPSTCLARLKALKASGVIKSFTIDVDPVALGIPIQALVSVRLRAGARHLMGDFADDLRQVPEINQFFVLGGSDDFIIHIAVRDTDHLRAFVLEHLSSNPAVAGTQTSLVFERVQGAAEY